MAKKGKAGTSDYTIPKVDRPHVVDIHINADEWQDIVDALESLVHDWKKGIQDTGGGHIKRETNGQLQRTCEWTFVVFVDGKPADTSA